MNTMLNWLIQLERKSHRDGAYEIERVGRSAFRVSDFPAGEMSSRMVPCPGADGIPLALAHGGLVGVDNRFRRAVLADGGGVNPNDAVAEASNLIELMGDEDDGAAGA